jgi:hypothetical protein
VEAEVLRVEFVCGIGGDPLVVLEEGRPRERIHFGPFKTLTFGRLN